MSFEKVVGIAATLDQFNGFADGSPQDERGLD
jgi:hypothetical protein